MGLFSSKKITIVANSVSKVIENAPNDFVTDAIVSAVLNSGDIPEYIKYAYSNNYSTKVDSYLRYGKSTFYRGLPEGSSATIYNIDLDVLIPIIKAEKGQDIIIQNVQLANFDEQLDVYYFLQNNYGWNATDNRLIYNSKYYTLENILYLDKGSYTKILIYISTDYYLSTPGYSNIITYYAPKVDPVNSLYYYATYLKNNKKYIWQYDALSNIYPQLSNIDSKTYYSQYLPIVPLRLNRQSITNNRSSNEYLTTKRILDRIDLDVEDIIDGLHSNPDIADVDDAFLLYGISVYTECESCLKYLFNYFKGLSSSSTSATEFITKYNSLLDDLEIKESDSDYSYFDPVYVIKDGVSNVNTSLPENTIVINESDFQCTLTYNYIDIEVVNGRLGNIGTCTRSIEVEENLVFEVQDIWEDSPTNTFKVYNSKLILNKQVTETTYERMTISGLVHRVTVPGTGKVLENILSEDPADPLKFYLPISYVALQELNAKDATAVLYESLIITVIAIKEEKVKWYQSGFLGFAFKIVLSIAIAWFTGYISFELGFTEAALTVAEATVVGITGFVIGEAISKIFTGTLGVLLQAGINFYLAGGYKAFTGSIKDLPWADIILEAVQTVFSFKSAGINSDLAELMKESSDFAALVERQQDELNKINEDLGLNTFYDRIYLDDSINVFDPNETPEAFFVRTIHTGNPGILGIDAVHNYISNSLTLPKPNTTDNVLIA